MGAARYRARARPRRVLRCTGATVTATNNATNIQTIRQTTTAGYSRWCRSNPASTASRIARWFPDVRAGRRHRRRVSVVGLNATAQVGNITQEVVVTAEAPPLATADARLGQTIRSDVYSALPLVMNTGGPRDPTAFMSIMPGVQSIGRWGNVMGGRTLRPTCTSKDSNHQRGLQGEGRNLSFGISVEAIDQFQVETSGYCRDVQRPGRIELRRQVGNEHVRGAGFEYFRHRRSTPRATSRPPSPTTTSTNTAPPRGPDCQEQDVLLPRLRRLPRPPAVGLDAVVDSNARAAQRRFQRAARDDLRSAHDTAQSERHRFVRDPFRATGFQRIASRHLEELPVVPPGADQSSLRTTISEDLCPSVSTTSA